MKKIYTLLLASIIVTSVQSQTVDLSLKLEKGKEYRQVTTSKSTIAQNMMGQEINITMTVNGTTSFLVKTINDDSYEMEAMYNNLSMSVEMPQGAKSYSSAKDKDNPIFSVLNKLKDKPFEVVMSKKGKIKEVRNTDLIEQTIIDSFEQLPEGHRGQMKAQIMEAFGGEAMKKNMELVTAIYPDKPMKKGDKWTINTSVAGDIALNVSTEYELVDFNSEYALIKGNATIKPGVKDAASMMPMDFEFSGSQIAEIKVDINTGWIIEAKTTQEIVGEIEMNMGGSQEIKGMEGGMKISMKMVQETLVTN